MRLTGIAVTVALWFADAAFSSSADRVNDVKIENQGRSPLGVRSGRVSEPSDSFADRLRRDGLAGMHMNSLLQQRQSSTGRCGADGGGARCPSPLCCSQFGYCGDSSYHCSDIAGCQPQYGACEGSIPSSTSSTAAPTTSTTSTRPTSTSTSTTSTSRSSSTTSSSVRPTGTLVASTNGMCGNSTTCAGTGYGSCCSEFFYCGSGTAYCGTGCQPEFGTCGQAAPLPGTTTTTSTTRPPTVPTTSSTTSVAAPTSSSAPLPPGMSTSTNGQCGGTQSCIGYSGGQCCSQFGFCGDGTYYCSSIAQCQPQFGICEG